MSDKPTRCSTLLKGLACGAICATAENVHAILAATTILEKIISKDFQEQQLNYHLHFQICLYSLRVNDESLRMLHLCRKRA